MNIGVVIGRFQIDNLHGGHDALLKAVAERSDVLCVMLGVTVNKVSRRNPLDFTTRKALIEGWHKNSGLKCTLVVLPIADQPSDLIWSKNVDLMLSQTFPGSKTILYGGRDSFLPHYKGRLKTEDLSKLLPVEQEISATQKRVEASSTPSDTDQFRKGVIYAAYNQWPRLFMCVDVIIYTPEVLVLGKRAQEDGLRFLGGFVDIEDECLESAALREASEEAGVSTDNCSPPEFISSFKVEDYRYKSKDDGLIMTAFFEVCVFDEDKLKAGDDIDSLVQIPLGTPDETIVSQMVESHRPMMKFYLERLKK